MRYFSRRNKNKGYLREYESKVKTSLLPPVAKKFVGIDLSYLCQVKDHAIVAGLALVDPCEAALKVLAIGNSACVLTNFLHYHIRNC